MLTLCFVLNVALLSQHVLLPCTDNTGIIVAVTLSTVVFVVLASFGAFIGYERLSKRKGGEIATKKLCP